MRIDQRFKRKKNEGRGKGKKTRGEGSETLNEHSRTVEYLQFSNLALKLHLLAPPLLACHMYACIHTGTQLHTITYICMYTNKTYTCTHTGRQIVMLIHEGILIYKYILSMGGGAAVNVPLRHCQWEWELGHSRQTPLVILLLKLGHWVHGRNNSLWKLQHLPSPRNCYSPLCM